jgi:hypothetical protein
MTEFTATTNVCKVDEKLGLVFGYAMVCKIDGEPYFDTQGHHIPEDTMLKKMAEFMEKGAVAKEMHRGEGVGRYLFAFPLTQEIAKSLGIEVKMTGALVAMKPDSKEILEKFASGQFTGFSIGGSNAQFKEVEAE